MKIIVSGELFHTGSPKIARFLGHSRSDLYNKNPIKIGDMRVDFYTLEHRECRAKRGARRERTNITKTGKMQSIFPERVSAYGVPENPGIFGESVSACVLS